MVATSGLLKAKATYGFLVVILLTSLVSCAQHKTYWLHLRPHAEHCNVGIQNEN